MNKLGVMEYGFLLLFVGLAVIFGINTNMIHSKKSKTSEKRFSSKYDPPGGSYMILWTCFMLVVNILLGMLFEGNQLLFYAAYSEYGPGFVLASVYYCILLALMPLLRKYIHPGTCAILWQLSFIAIIMGSQAAISEEPPNVIIPIPEIVAEILPILFWIWLAVFLIIFGWNILSHIRYRRWVLKVAKPVCDPEVLKVWDYELKLGKMGKHEFDLVTSERVQTPLSIGLFRGTTCVILPDKLYIEDDLHFIFRHELIHIGREDAKLKFCLMFTTALLWFNPLMWVAKRYCSDDLELGCDELVVQYEDRTTRKEYAQLLLETAGDNRGFTTCLSASAGAMRYRLRNIVEERKRYAGGVLVGVMVILLAATAMIWRPLIGFSHHPGTAAERVFSGQAAEELRFEYIRLHQSESAEDKGWLVRAESGDGEAIVSYFYGLHVSEVTAACQPGGSDAYSYVKFRSDKNYYLVYFVEEVLYVYTSNAEGKVWRCFVLEEPLDEEYLWSLCEPAGEREYLE